MHPPHLSLECFASAAASASKLPVSIPVFEAHAVSSYNFKRSVKINAAGAELGSTYLPKHMSSQANMVKVKWCKEQKAYRCIEGLVFVAAHVFGSQG